MEPAVVSHPDGRVMLRAEADLHCPACDLTSFRFIRTGRPTDYAPTPMPPCAKCGGVFLPPLDSDSGSQARDPYGIIRNVPSAFSARRPLSR